MRLACSEAVMRRAAISRERLFVMMASAVLIGLLYSFLRWSKQGLALRAAAQESGLEARGVRQREIQTRIGEALELVQLNSLRDRLPHELSGGQKQRVALARAVVIRPDVLLLDEPLSALDLRLRQELRVGLKKVQGRLGLTTLLVTHDQGEALSLSDRIAVMSQGEMLQIDRPSRIYQHPHRRSVADFIGNVKFLECEIVRIAMRVAISPDFERGQAGRSRCLRSRRLLSWAIDACLSYVRRMSG
jgi:ABC-type proline/glycine betaine transport system ATPase subunit